MHRPRTHTAALLFSALAVASGCEDTNERLTLTLVDPPPGGETPTLAISPSGALIAPTARGVFALEEGRDAWTRWNTSWPNTLKPNPQVALEGLARAGATFPFGSEELMARAGGASWMLTESAPGAPALLRSTDGKRWKLSTLPSEYIPVTAEVSPSQPSAPALSGAPISPALTLRLLASEGSIYLVDSTKVWKHEHAEDAPVATSWREVSLEGVDLERASVRLELPASLRHYLPATRTRPYELLTVLTDQVLVYRRALDTESFILIHAQPRLDRTLIDSDDGRVYALTHDAVLAARDDGERWDALKPNAESPLSALALLAGDTSGLIVGTEHGAIWVDEEGDGRAWKRTRDPDPDGRAIHDLILHDGAIYASTAGQGVLRSIDRGATWTPMTKGLDAAKAYALARGTSGDVLVGTDAGLFGLGIDDGAYSWRPLHPRATTALLSNGITHSGTLGGDILTGNGATWDTREVFDDVSHHSARHQSTWISPSSNPASVTQLARRPGSRELLASASRRGVATSSDGSTWELEQRDPALDEALGQTPILSEAIARDGTRFALSHASDLVPAQVWRRRRGRWSSVHWLPDASASAFLLSNDEALWLAQGPSLMRSIDGDVWRDVDVPWGDRVVVAARARGTRLEFTLMGERSHELFALEGGEIVARHTLTFESGWNPPQPRDVLLTNDHVYALTPHGVFVSSLETSRRELPRGASMFFVIGATILLAMVGFGVMRGGRRRRL